jgi:VanZ family protein
MGLFDKIFGGSNNSDIDQINKVRWSKKTRQYYRMALFFLFAFLEREKKDKTLLIVWLICAVLLNPFIKIALGRPIWNIVDIILSLILLYSIWQDRNILQNKKSESL